MKQYVSRLALVAGLLVPALPAWADLLIGQSSGFTGPAAPGVKENTEGARLYFDWVNAQGGIHGQAVELVSLDDRFDPAVTVENARKLVVEKNALALFLVRGTPHAQALLPLLNEHKVPLVAPSTGAMALHKPVQPYVFNVRASYQREAERAIRHLSLVSVERIAVLQVDDSFGADAMQGATTGFEAVGRTPVAHEKFDRSKPDFAAIAPRIAKAQPQAVLFIGSAGAVADGTAALRKAGSFAQIVTLSNNASGGFIKQMGAHAHGTIVSQVFPYERSIASGLVREALDLAKAKKLDGVTPAMMEGFAGAKVLVEALRRAGPNPTRERLVAALNGMTRWELGGMEFSYSPGDHTGLDFADLSIVNGEGRFTR